jgi:hypothetical protein
MGTPCNAQPYKYWRPDQPLPAAADLERFRSYIIVGADTECWPWRTLRRGVFWWRINGVRHCELSSRLAFRLAHGRDIGPREIVAHRCDWRPCRNPAHLEIKTQRANVQDSVDRGMHPYIRSGRYRYTRRYLKEANGPGEANARHTLTTDAVRAIRERYVPGLVRQADLAAEFGVGRSTISRIVQGRSWTHILSAGPA